MARLPQGVTLDMMQNTWARFIEPLLSSPIANGHLLTGIALAIGSNTINHKLGRVPQGYIIVDNDAAVSVYKTASRTPDLTLNLTSNAACTVSLWCF